MSEILIHKSSDYIEEDRDYYYSDTRDKHGMIQPSDDMVSVSCDSNIFKPNPTNDEICSIYYPFEKKSFHRIYLGISFPLFANNWGAAFLRHLMYLIKPDGSVILPVYAERQGVEKNYWSRSSLEVIFQSRQKWWGMSNIWAENDGVMSMRIGKKEPPIKNSTLNPFLENDLPLIKDNVEGDDVKNLIQKHHINGITSAIVEQIIINYFGRNKGVTFCDIEGDGLLSSEILMSDYVNIIHSTQYISEDHNIEQVNKYLSKEFASKFSIHAHKKSALELNANYDVITIIDTLQHLPEKDKELFIINTFKMLNEKGTLIIKDNLFNNIESINSILNKLGDTVEHSQYSSVVATKHKDKTNIAHYSDIIFDELKSENQKRQNVFNVLYKK